MRDLALFTRQLAGLVQGGLPLREGLNQLAQVFPHRGYKKAAQELEAGLTRGFGFSEQLARYPRLFPPFYRTVVETGESGDSLLPALNTLVTYYSEQEKIKNRLLRIMFYPLLLLGVAAVSGSVALWFVVPGFRNLYGVLGGEIPAATRWIFALAQAVTPARLLAAVVALLVLLGAALWFFIKKVQWPTLAKVPLVSTLYCYWFCLVTAMIVGAGHTLEQALVMAATVSPRGPAPAALLSLREGNSLYQALAGSPGVLRSFVAQGERVGELPTALVRASDYYQLGLEESLENFQRLLEPLSVLIVGGAVAAMLLILMLPVLQLARVF